MSSGILCLTVHICPFSPPSSLLSAILFSSRTGGHTGARDRFTCRNECQPVFLGFPLYRSSDEGVRTELHLELSLDVPESPVCPSLPLFPFTEGRRELNSLITNPSLWTKRICINPGAIESLHKTHSHITPHPPKPQHPQFNFEVKSLSSTLPSSLTHSLSPRIPCRWCSLTWYFPLHLVFPSLLPLG